jgi:hypothetical protein
MLGMGKVRQIVATWAEAQMKDNKKCGAVIYKSLKINENYFSREPETKGSANEGK